MYDPTLNDNYNEWIELYNPTNYSINLSGWSIADNTAEDYLEGDFDHGNGTTIIPSKGYAIIADHGTQIDGNFSIPANVTRLYVDDASIGNGLSNNADKLILKNATGAIIDAMEWGYNYTEVPGSPALVVIEGHSLARHHGRDTDNTLSDFFEQYTPTPGLENVFTQKPKINMTQYPCYLPKVYNVSSFSFPFGVCAEITNGGPNTAYQLKAYVTGSSTSTLPTTQTWNGFSWKYSNYYTSTITTDSQGNWSDWVYLRFNSNYKEYQRAIRKNTTAYLWLKVKTENITYSHSQQVLLLDLDNSSSNGTAGGYVVGVATFNVTTLDNTHIVLKNNTAAYAGAYAGIYATEDNQIEEGFCSSPGYYRITGPVGNGYTLEFFDNTGTTFQIIENVTIRQGRYALDMHAPNAHHLMKKHAELDVFVSVKNTGDFSDVVTMAINDSSPGWIVDLLPHSLSLDPQEERKICLHVSHRSSTNERYGTVSLSATSVTDPGERDELTLSFELLGPDLNVTTVKFYDSEGEQRTSFSEGEMLRIKAFCKNVGNENATNATVSFYYDKKDDNHLIGTKGYDSIETYQKYPSVVWDTKGISAGEHTIYVVAEEDNFHDELNKDNNELMVPIIIFDSLPPPQSRKLIIGELYYHTYPNIKNEFVALYNPTNDSINLTGWYLTHRPAKQQGSQPKLIFPKDTYLPSKTWLHITQNASDYLWQTGETADFEYAVDADESIPQMNVTKTVTLSNTGGEVALKDWYNHTIDLVVYGNSLYTGEGWNGPSILSSGRGVILKRNTDWSGTPIDTNTSRDWENARRYQIGQSMFPYTRLSCYGEITTFVSPDCSYDALVNEIRNAQQSIYFNIYEFTHPFLCDELINALKRGVAVHIFLEGSPIGGISDREFVLLERIAQYGGKIRFIVNDEEKNVYARYTFDHGKYLVIDNETVIVESCNWAKTGIPPNPSFGNREWGIIVRNESVARYFLSVFLDDWNPARCDSYALKDMPIDIPVEFFVDKTIFTGSYEPQFVSKTVTGSFSVTPVFSPDTSLEAICNLIESANESILIEQLYVYKEWGARISPFVERLIKKANEGVQINVILNYNPYYEASNDKCNQTKQHLEQHNISVKFLYTNWSYFTNVHNKGMIVDNRSVLISSINWNENSVTRNREAGIIIEHEEVAQYYAEVFYYDWYLTERDPPITTLTVESQKNTIYITMLFTMTFAIIARDWRKRQWS